MAERDMSQREKLFSDVPGNTDKLRTILLSWGVEEASIRRMMRERRTEREHRTYPADINLSRHESQQIAGK